MRAPARRDPLLRTPAHRNPDLRAPTRKPLTSLAGDSAAGRRMLLRVKLPAVVVLGVGVVLCGGIGIGDAYRGSALRALLWFLGSMAVFVLAFAVIISRPPHHAPAPGQGDDRPELVGG